MTIEAVLFDAGETLLHPEPSWSDLCISILHERGHEHVTLDEMRRAWVVNGDLFVKAANEGNLFSTSTESSREFWMTLYTKLIAEIGLDDDGAAEEMYRTFSDPKSYGLFEDAVPVLDELASRGIRLGLISNFESWLRTLLDHLAVSDRFEVLAISGDLGWEKPDHRIFRWALDEMHLAPERSMYVGDNPHFDPVPAIELGMHGVLLDRHGRWVNDDLGYPRVSSLTELPALIEAL